MVRGRFGVVSPPSAHLDKSGQLGSGSNRAHLHPRLAVLVDCFYNVDTLKE